MSILQANNLSISFSGFKAVDNYSIKVQKGSIIGLIGPNGAGKTSLFQLLSGSLKADSGTVIFEGQDLSSYSTDIRFQRGLVRTFQIPHEFHRLTTLENLMMVPKQQAGEHLFANWFQPGKVKQNEKLIFKRALQTLEFLELTHIADELAGNLSGGQKKLLELGRTMMSDAKLVLLDEVAAGVNRTLLRKLEEKILLLNQQGYTFLLIEHDMDMVKKLCNPVICMAQGRLLIEADFETVINNPDVLEAYLGESVNTG